MEDPMGLRISFVLMLLLGACAAPFQAAPELSVPTDVLLEPSAPENKGSVPGSSVVLTVWNAEQPQIRLVDMARARDVPGFAPIHAYPQTLSADGRMLAAIESHGESCEAFAGGTSCRGNAAVL